MSVVESFFNYKHAEAHLIDSKLELSGMNGLGLAEDTDQELFVLLLARGLSRYEVEGLLLGTPDIVRQMRNSSEPFLKKVAYQLLPKNLPVWEATVRQASKVIQTFRSSKYPYTDAQAAYFAQKVDNAVGDLMMGGTPVFDSHGRRQLLLSHSVANWVDVWRPQIDRVHHGSMGARIFGKDCCDEEFQPEFSQIIEQ